MAALQIKWEPIQHVAARDTAVVTGDSEEEAARKGEAAKLPETPMVILVGDLSSGGDIAEKLEKVVFKAENVALAMKAFRTVQMMPSDAASDPLTMEAGSEVPRLLVWDPTKAKMNVLEKGKITASALFGMLKKVSDAYYVQNLEKTVKGHLKLLTERDQLANREKVLRDKSGRLEEEKDKNAKDLAEVAKEIEEVTKELEALATKERELWKLTRKEKVA